MSRSTHCAKGHPKELAAGRWICKRCSYAGTQAWREKNRRYCAKQERERYAARKVRLIEQERRIEQERLEGLTEWWAETLGLEPATVED